MTAVSIFRFALPILAGVAILAAVVFLFRALSRRSQSSKAAYNVGQQEAKVAMQVDLVRVVAAFVAGVILFGIFSLLPEATNDVTDLIEPTPRPFVTPDVNVLPTNTSPPAVSLPTSTLPAPEESTIAAPPTASALPVVVETAVTPPTSTPEPATAIVSSGVGVWLRSVPSVDGEQLEWLLEGAVLILVEGEQATADNLAWQQVQAASGLVGWVAVPFIELPE